MTLYRTVNILLKGKDLTISLISLKVLSQTNTTLSTHLDNVWVNLIEEYPPILHP